MNRFLLTHPDAAFVALCFGAALLSIVLSAVIAFTI
jgi:hypothetical protein